MNIADAFPARRQADGRYWYRNGGGDGSWSPSRELAHDDYQCIVCFGHPSRCDCPDGPTHPEPATTVQIPHTPITAGSAIACQRCGQYGHPEPLCPTRPPITIKRGGMRYGTPCAWCDTVHDGGPENCPGAADPEPHPALCSVCDYQPAAILGRCMDCDVLHTAGCDHPLGVDCEHCNRPSTSQPTITVTREGIHHPVEPQPQEHITMTAEPFTGPAPRETKWAKYPLPPMLPRPIPKFNQWKQYVLPDPVTGLPTGFVRATTVAKTLDNTYNLSRWATRQQVAAVLRLADVATAPGANDVAVKMYAELRTRIDAGNGSNVNDLLEVIDGFAGGKNSAEFGDAVHEWCAALDASMITVDQVPELFVPWVQAYQGVLARAGLIAVAQYVERLVMCDDGIIERIVGTLDRLFWCVTTGELYLGDLKTSKADNIKYNWVTWPTQLVGYARARLMFGLDGQWEPMPTINQDVGLLIHLPSDAPKQAHLVAMKLAPADAYMATSLQARHHDKNAKHDVPGVAPVPTAEALRYVAAYQAIQSSHSVDDLNAVWDRYRDVWRPELTELGHTVAKLFTAPTA